MRKALISLSMVALLTGCMQTRYITEQYIKTNVEKHTEGEYSTIRTYTVFKGKSYNSNSYLELTGYKYRDISKLVIGADKYYPDRKQFETDQTRIADITYIELTLEQCKAILQNYQILQEKINKEKPLRNEEVYHDYTVSKDLFISYRKAKGSISSTYIEFWVQGEKFVVSTPIIMDKLRKFMDYVKVTPVQNKAV
ncbi:hypothetical protein V6R21_05735 [Limibacter armeniacum]|uniref:hypothetical protein n=1 Tax=Limibacter armeniacum TaxID=466084 RepID=UPI002FE55A1A